MAKQSKLRKMLSDACIGEFYTLKGYFFKVYPCFDIDKVKFSFVAKGKSGAGFDIYVDTPKFEILCEDIRNGLLMRKIEADNGKYPNAWKYITGENASKELSIGKGQNGGIVVQGRVKGEGPAAKNAFVPLTGYDELRLLAKWYLLFAGDRPAEGYYAMLYDVFWIAYRKKGAYYENGVSDQDEEYVERREPGAAKNPAANLPNRAQPAAPAADVPNRAQAAPAAREASQDVKATTVHAAQEERTGQFYTNGQFEQSRDKKVLRIKARDKTSGNESFLFFNRESIQTITEEKFASLFEATKKNSVLLAIQYVLQPDGTMLFKRFG